MKRRLGDLGSKALGIVRTKASPCKNKQIPKLLRKAEKHTKVRQKTKTEGHGMLMVTVGSVLFLFISKQKKVPKPFKHCPLSSKNVPST